MFHLTTHSIHFYLRLYGVGHIVKDHSDNEKGTSPISNMGSFIYAIPQTSGTLAGLCI